MFDTEFNYFIKNQTTLVKQYGGKFLVLIGEKVVDVHDTALAAYTESKEKYGLGEFMIQPCSPGPDAYTVSISAANTIFK